MEQKLLRFIHEHELTMYNKKVIIAVSGGPDSVVLLHVFKKWRKQYNLQLYAITINHQLRKEAKEDVKHVANLCNKWDIPLVTKHINVRHYKREHNVSTQVAARNLRYKAFNEVMQEKNAHFLALGHHGDDQIETIIMSLMRTTSLSSLIGIPFRRPFSNGEIIRPLLTASKAEIEQYCIDHNLHYRIDPSNKDLSYTRNFVRELIVPNLKKKNRSLHVTMQQLAETLQEDERYLQAESYKIFKQIAKLQSDERKVTINIAHLQKYPTPLQRRVYRLTLDYLYDTLPPHLSHSHEQIFLSLLKEKVKNKVLHFPQQLLIEKVYEQIECYFKKDGKKPFSAIVHQIPTTVPLPDGGVIEIINTDYPIKNCNENEYICSASQVSLPLEIRTRKPGDRMRYKGLNGSKKIKDIFIDEKIPRQKRDEIIVIADNDDEILWLIGIRKAVLQRKANKEAPYILFRYIKD